MTVTASNFERRENDLYETKAHSTPQGNFCDRQFWSFSVK